ncbi:DNA alkylation repair protein [Pedobacter sp. HMF7647]|uniref:DNA alkylation repair protein n=1 Tax=Hufsiella arboris TaxID=2695275 RepID=A0A7K1Y9J6_9SPHI|nr:DNA alkylation repair protein [Hufsiella arboris]MXV50728.1 DNA alkylation repair protein [Hufsiella arboris]
MEILTAESFYNKLVALQQEKELENVRRFYRDPNRENKFIGVRMADIFALAKEFKLMPIEEIEKLLLSDYYEARMGAVSIMDFQARSKTISAAQKKQLFDLYISRHERINNWDLVDRSAPYVVGGYLDDKPRDILYRLANSENVWERRTAIVSTYYFIRQNQLEDTFRIAELLIHDEHDLIQKAVGSWLREAGKHNKQKLLSFLNSYHQDMARITLRYAIENLDDTQKSHYLRASAS